MCFLEPKGSRPAQEFGIIAASVNCVASGSVNHSCSICFSHHWTAAAPGDCYFSCSPGRRQTEMQCLVDHTSGSGATTALSSSPVSHRKKPVRRAKLDSGFRRDRFYFRSPSPGKQSSIQVQAFVAKCNWRCAARVGFGRYLDSNALSISPSVFPLAAESITAMVRPTGRQMELLDQMAVTDKFLSHVVLPKKTWRFRN